MAGACIIAGAGEYYGRIVSPRPDDWVIAADGGYLRLCHMGVRADEVIGDFDSLGFRPNHPNVQQLPVEKDDTDTLFALRAGVKKGFRIFHIYGGTGGRLDHTLANIQCLAWLAGQGLRGWLYGDGCALTALRNGTMAFEAPAGRTASVFALGGDADGVTIEGLKYTVENIRLTGVFPIGVSNETTGRPARISVRNGALLLVLPDETRVIV